MRSLEARGCLDERAGHAEGPVWDDVRGELLWVDLYAGLVRTAPGLRPSRTPGRLFAVETGVAGLPTDRFRPSTVEEWSTT